MDERRRRLIKVASIGLLPAVAGCAEQSNGGNGGSDSEQGSTPEPQESSTDPPETGTPTDTGAGMPTETPVGTGTDTSSRTEVQTDAETSTPSETRTPTPSETPVSTNTPASSDSLGLVITNVGFRAWEVTEDESGSVAPLNTNNPTLSFEVGQRYAVENRGWYTHPFALRANDDSPLLSQSADGQFEGDDAVNWTDEGETFAFTFTEDLAAAVDYYICTNHSGMRGEVETA